LVLALTILLLPSPPARGAEMGLPRLRKQGSAAQLVVDGQPLVMLAGELHNSSSSSLQYMKPIWPRLASLNLNTVIASISWELVEPEEGNFDFSLVDGLIEGARRHDLKLVFIWFATWKNGDGTYVPAWVKTNWTRFPRCQHRPGINSSQLSPMSEENAKADATAFAAVMRHIRGVDGEKHTVVMMQVENEAGIMPVARDHCSLAEQAFAKPVPRDLMDYLIAYKDTLIPNTRDIWGTSNFRESGTWSEVFADDADEVFSAYMIGRYIGRVAAAGKAEYPLPMYVNAWLVQHKGQKAGQYPSGGPVARMLDIWRAAAPSIDLLAPDVYLDDFKAICAEYTQSGNPLFIPEARRDEIAGLRAFYAIGHHHALGFAPFGIDSLEETNVLRDHYAVLGSLLRLITAHQGKESLKGFMQYRDDKQVEFDIGDFRADIEYRSDKGAKTGGGLVIATAPDTFVIAGTNYGIRFASRPNKPGHTAWLSIEEGTFRDGKWMPGRRLNGDEASWRVNLGPEPRVLIGKVYWYP
jgi:beta-galactosidase GanA